ncbi:MAG: hypothetical protein ACM34K_19835 [Bacillota bacterium]
MTDTEKSKLLMYENVLHFLSGNREITENIKAFEWSIAKLWKIINQIELRENQLSGSILEGSIKATKAKDILISSLLPIARGLCELAKQSGNEVLRQQCKITKCDLFRLSEAELIDKISSVESIAENYPEELRRLGITSGMIAELKKLNGNYESALNSKQLSILPGTTLLEIRNLYANADVILSSYVDNFVEALSEEYPEFREEYISLRNPKTHPEIL